MNFILIKLSLILLGIPLASGATEFSIDSSSIHCTGDFVVQSLNLVCNNYCTYGSQATISGTGKLSILEAVFAL